MLNKENLQIRKTDAEELALLQTQLNDEKKLVLYGFALGLKAENQFLNEKQATA